MPEVQIKPDNLEELLPLERHEEFDPILECAIAKYRFEKSGTHYIECNGELLYAEWFHLQLDFTRKIDEKSKTIQANDHDGRDFFLLIVKNPKNGKPPNIKVFVDPVVNPKDVIKILPLADTSEVKEVDDYQQMLPKEQVRAFRIERSQSWEDWKHSTGNPFPPVDWQSNDDIISLKFNIPKDSFLAISALLRPTDGQEVSYTDIKDRVFPVAAGYLSDGKDVNYSHCFPQSIILTEEKGLILKSNGFIYYYIDPDPYNFTRWVKANDWEILKHERSFFKSIDILLCYRLGKKDGLQQFIESVKKFNKSIIPDGRQIMQPSNQESIPLIPWNAQPNTPFLGFFDDTLFEFLMGSNYLYQTINTKIATQDFTDNPFALF